MQIPIHRSLSIVILAFLAVTLLPAEEVRDIPKVEVIGSGWSADHQLVLGVKITAPRSKSLTLGKDAGSIDQAVTLFTTKESWLIDIVTGNKIPASRRFPNQPNFGWIKSSETIGAGDFREFTAAFPAPPLPPVVNGKRQDYQLELHLPGGLPPVTFRIPVPAELTTTP